MRFKSQAFNHARKTVTSLKDIVSEGLVEEKQVAAHPVAVEHFCQQVNDLRSATARLEARVAQLQTEKKQ